MGQKINMKKEKEKEKDKQDIPLDKIEKMLFDTYKNTDIDFTYREVLTLKLREADAEKYFINNFDYLIYFNSYIFQQRLNVLYDNFSAIVENFVKENINNITRNFLMLVDFDDESISVNDVALNPYNFMLDNEGNIVEIPNSSIGNQNNIQQNKIEYESLFTVIFEPLEIKTILFFLMTNHNKSTVNDFFSQLYENIYLYKNNRKYDSMYFLLPNLDFFIRNESYVLYIVNRPNQFDESLSMLSDYTISYVNEYTDSLFTSLYFKEMLNVNYDKENKEGNNLIDNFLINIIPPFFIKGIFKFDISITNIDDFILKYQRDFKIFNLMVQNSNVNEFIIKLYLTPITNNYVSMTTRNNYNQINVYNNFNLDIFKHLIKKLINIADKSKFNKGYLIIRFFLKNKKINTLSAKEDGKKLSNEVNGLINSLINDSFIYTNRNEYSRKVIIEYFDLYYTDKELVDLNDSNENINMKISTIYKYYKWKIYYCYFLTKKHIKKMKKYIYNILHDKINDKKPFGKIFKFLFDEKYYISQISNREGKLNENEIEKMIYL